MMKKTISRQGEQRLELVYRRKKQPPPLLLLLVLKKKRMKRRKKVVLSMKPMIVKTIPMGIMATDHSPNQFLSLEPIEKPSQSEKL